MKYCHAILKCLDNNDPCMWQPSMPYGLSCQKVSKWMRGIMAWEWRARARGGWGLSVGQEGRAWVKGKRGGKEGGGRGHEWRAWVKGMRRGQERGGVIGLWATLMGNTCGQHLWATLVGNTCGHEVICNPKWQWVKLVGITYRAKLMGKTKSS